MLYGRARLRLPQATREEFCAMLAVAHGGLGDGLHLYQGLALPTSLAAHRAQPLCSCRTPLARDRHATHARGRCFCGRCGRGSRARRGGQRAARALARRAHGGWWPPRRSRVGVRRHRAARAQRARRRTVPACRRPLTAKVCLRRALCYRGWLLASTESERCCMAQPHIHGTTRPLVSRALQAATPPRRHVATSPRRHVATSPRHRSVSNPPVRLAPGPRLWLSPRGALAAMAAGLVAGHVLLRGLASQNVLRASQF